MIDLNHILLFIAIVAPVILLARTARRPGVHGRGWRFAAIIVLTSTALASFFVPAIAGLIGGTFWILLLVIPSLAEWKIDELFLTQRFAAAHRLAVVRHILHPWPGSPHRPSLYYNLELARAGRLDLALEGLAQERTENTPAGRFAAALSFVLTENWPGLLEWFRRNSSVPTSPGFFSLYLRALGERGELDELVHQVDAQFAQGEASARTHFVWRFNLAIALAFAGRTNDFVRLTQVDDRLMSAEKREFWRATAELTEGKQKLARERLDKLSAETNDAVLRRSIAHRLLATATPSSLSAKSTILLNRIVSELLGRRASVMRPGWRSAGAVWALLLLNIALFFIELRHGGSTNPETLHYLGALEPPIRHEYWRLLSSCFLHYGALHLSVNLFALYLLGPPLEQLIGSMKFLIGYLLCGIGAGIGVIFVSKNGTQLVGASGAIMGVIGISAGLLLRHRRTTLAGRQLRNILVIVAIQTAFDLWTPQISMAAHLSGFLSGIVVGLIFASLDRPQPAL